MNMKKFRLSQPILASELIPHGITIEFDQTNSQMKLFISDKNLEKFRCDLVEDDNPIDYPNTTSVLEIVLENLINSFDQKIEIFSTIHSDDLIFGYFEYEVLKPMGIELTETLCYTL
jgi:hypothetical protein